MKKQIWFPVLGLVLIGGLFLTRCEKGSDFDQNTEYVVFAWNDLGMHCLNPSYNELVILPPYNNLCVQVIKRGVKPELITEGVTVEYKLKNNTDSYSKGSYGQFWDQSDKLFGVELAHNVGLKGNSLSGEMAVSGDHFIAEGIPVVPVDDAGTWDPYQVAEITVKDAGGTIIATTEATVPTSDEINCAKCHGNGSNTFVSILAKHDEENHTQLVSSQPVLCAGCHGSPALGGMEPGTSGKFLSEAIHGFHAEKQASCYDCHPGAITKCSRSLAHTSDNGNCTTCHGTMAQVAETVDEGRIPWVTEPTCVTCHPDIEGIDTGTSLYRNSQGHGGVNCTTCHGSPHSMMPSRVLSDNFASNKYQNFKGRIKSIGSCGACHRTSRGEGSEEFGGVHGGANPEEYNACHTCHTQLSTDVSKWPHAFQWKAR